MDTTSDLLHDPTGRECALAGRKADGHDVPSYCEACYDEILAGRMPTPDSDRELVAYLTGTSDPGEREIRLLETEGLTRSDAQGVAMANHDYTHDPLDCCLCNAQGEHREAAL